MGGRSVNEVAADIAVGVGRAQSCGEIRGRDGRESGVDDWVRECKDTAIETLPLDSWRRSRTRILNKNTQPKKISVGLERRVSQKLQEMHCGETD